MEILQNSEFTERLINMLKFHARNSSCTRSRCGAIIMKNNLVIATGYNSQPLNHCGKCFKEELAPGFKSDKTCCVHAEQRAIMNGLKENPAHMKGSTLYFLRIDIDGYAKASGEPYCSICSKMALDAGIKYFALWRSAPGVPKWHLYETEEYNHLTFQYGKV